MSAVQFQDVGTDDTYIFNQYLMCLYASLFMTRYAATDLYDAWQDTIRSLQAVGRGRGDRIIRDKYLLDFLNSNLGRLSVEPSVDSLPDAASLQLIAQRVASDRCLDKSILDTILFLTGRTTSPEEVTLYTVELSSVQDTTLVLTHVGRIILDPAQRPGPDVVSAWWRLVFSIQCDSPHSLMHLISTMAVRLDIGYDRARCGMPFSNRIAMLRLAKRMRTYQAVTAKPSLISEALLSRVEHFYRGDGIGVYDAVPARLLMDTLYTKFKEKDSVEFINRVISLVFAKQAAVSFRKKAAVEAASADDEHAKNAFPDDEAADAEAADNAFPDDSASDTATENTSDLDSSTAMQDDSQTSPDDGSNNITSAEQSVPAETSVVGTLIPMASASETLDDMLFKLSILHRCHELQTAKDPGVSPDVLAMFKTWCSQYLFLASADATKSFLSQLKLTGISKEFAR